MWLIANRQLCGDYGNVVAGQQFYCPDEKIAASLVERGLATPAHITYPQRTYETKVITPEVQPLPAQPFRHVPDPDPEPPALAAVRDAVCAVSDVPAQGTADRVERAGRKRGGRK